MKTRVSIALTMGLLMVGVYVSGQGQAPQPSQLTTQKLADDLFVIRNAFVPGNTTVLVTNEGVVLVDDKFEVDVENVLAQVKTVTNQPIRYVVNTHHHGDHSGGNARLQMQGVQAIAHERARELMVEGNQPGLPTMTFSEKSEIHLGGKTVELYWFGRAHTAGDIFAYFPAQRVLATGDAYTQGTATPQLIDYQGGGSAKEWPQTLDKALMLDFDRVVPGHGEVVAKADLQKFRDAADAMQKRVRQMLRERATPEQITAVLKAEFNGTQLVFPGAIDGLLLELR